MVLVCSERADALDGSVRLMLMQEAKFEARRFSVARASRCPKGFRKGNPFFTCEAGCAARHHDFWSRLLSFCAPVPGTHDLPET